MSLYSERLRKDRLRKDAEKRKNKKPKEGTFTTAVVIAIQGFTKDVVGAGSDMNTAQKVVEDIKPNT